MLIINTDNSMHHFNCEKESTTTTTTKRRVFLFIVSISLIVNAQLIVIPLCRLNRIIFIIEKNKQKRKTIQEQTSDEFKQ